MLGNVLSAAELLVNKGICHETWERWNKTAEILPSVGQKQYEPNSCWLQKKQIEKGLNDRKELLGVERVERKSQLAAAEWLPQESRARVTKKSGQEWTNFGVEENCQLYLIPEEALMLLELNCLELSWDGVALSVQQAYSILLESNPSGCTLHEYRVYSHLVRQGYRLQRYRFNDCCMAKNDSIESTQLRTFKRKKLVHDPCNSFWLKSNLCGDQAKNSSDHEIIKPEVDNQETKSNTSSIAKISKPSSSDGQGDKMETHFSYINKQETMSPLLNKESNKSNDTCLKSLRVSASEAYDNGVLNLPGPSKFCINNDNKNSPRTSRLRIISNETFLGDLKIVSACPGSHVHKKVRQFPKEEILADDSDVLDHLKKSNQMQGSDNSGIKEVFGVSKMDIHKKNVNADEGVEVEVIEVSDDEIQEVPQRMPRIEMLNLLPNCGYTKFVATPILRRYLPPNVNPKRVWKPDLTTKISNLDKCSFNNRVHKISQVTAMKAVNIPAPTSFPGNKHANHDCTNQEVIKSLSSFKKISGASSWAETKAKWLEEETITIEDEEYKPNEETEVKVLAQLVKPLVGPQNASSLTQVYKSLQIIKASTFNNVRWLRKRKQPGYKISYNLYSTAQHFKKSNPGTPMSRIVVCNSGNTPVIELADILLLQNDAKDTPVILACVSEASVNFVELGRVRIPVA
ncbi:uncharacterized protein LOC105690667 isoform X1 [Athalia rosae]|uniref:uncharacterized protein LOC105690667 isoform X1 n=1 Tax=Athalia rosae TaxID=37344 RepID=UPI0020345B8A|nr:uncharacterized protein LOC105690667 isoform X1 [Athalia rosae]